MNRRAIWNSIKENNALYSDFERKRLRNSVFNREAVEERCTGNAYLRNISMGWRAMRWIATHMIPEVYEKFETDGKRNWSEARAQSYFLSGVEALFLVAFVARRKQLRISGSGRAMFHISLQFGGSEVLMTPSPVYFKNSRWRHREEDWIQSNAS